MRRARLTFGFALSVATLGALPLGAANGDPGRHSWCGTQPRGAHDAVWAHREHLSRDVSSLTASQASTSSDVGNIAVLKDEGDLASVRNALDLQGKGLQFSPLSVGYVLSPVDRPVAVDGGGRLTLTDDSSQAVPLPFAFTYYGKTYSEVFVNSDGDLTFGLAESASAARSLGRFLGGPPRIAPFFTDLDPGAGGSVTTSGDGDHFRVTWTDVPRFENTDKNTVQVTLNRDGRVEFAYASNVAVLPDEAVVGIAPGADEGGAAVVDLSVAAGVSSAGAIAETFHADNQIDTVATARKFYRTHPDDYQQLIVYTSRTLIGRSSEAFAYEQTVKNPDTGIGAEVVDLSAEFGSAGHLESFVLMDTITKYPDDLNQKFLGEDSTLSVLAHEVGHRWLAQARFRDGAINSEELLGRQKAHWSFAMDSDGSHDEGNEIQDLGGGQFRTGPASVKYGPLDQYLMGLRLPEEVPPFFFIRAPKFTIGNGAISPERGPQADVLISGTRKDVTVGDVIAAIGPRNPPPAPNGKPFRQAFIYVTLGEPNDAQAIEKIERIRAAFETYFVHSTDGRGAVESRLN